MQKKILQMMVVLSLLLYLSLAAIPQPKKETIVTAETDQELEDITIEEYAAPIVTSPLEYSKNIIFEEPEPEPEPINEEPYFVDIVDGYITEESLRSICIYVGDLYDIPPNILHALAYVESRYNVNATGASGDSGLCQIIPKWNRDRMKRLGVTDIYDPYSNVLVCADILKYNQSAKYGNDIRFMLMAYNMGVGGATKKYEAGIISNYANKVLAKSYELDY